MLPVDNFLPVKLSLVFNQAVPQYRAIFCEYMKKLAKSCVRPKIFPIKTFLGGKEELQWVYRFLFTIPAEDSCDTTEAFQTPNCGIKFSTDYTRK